MITAAGAAEPGRCRPSFDIHLSNSATRRKAIPLFLLFLQEIISERHRRSRRNPEVPARRPRKEQRPVEWCSGVNPV
jgi:hypothetical protein